MPSAGKRLDPQRQAASHVEEKDTDKSIRLLETPYLSVLLGVSGTASAGLTPSQ